ncbi:hypothetical protein Adt_11532 [Abeliophyllum distichum]|uniref:Uncharacterized protein n=1 Tax=Abeliophyllum distichum TaxID=126358 RepID=A0ABD1UP29_9LAMI
MDQGMRPRPTMVCLASSKPKSLASGSSEDSKQKKVIDELCLERNKREAVVTGSKKKAVEVVDNYAVCSPPPLQRTLSVTTAGEVVLDIPPKVPQSSERSDGGSYDSKRKLKELIGPLGARIPDDAVRNLPFYPAMVVQAFKKYFNPRWEDLASYGDLEDALEASLVAAVRTTEMQLKVLGEFRLQMQRHKKLAADASMLEEYKQAIKRLQVVVESMCMAYERQTSKNSIPMYYI